MTKQSTIVRHRLYYDWKKKDNNNSNNNKTVDYSYLIKKHNNKKTRIETCEKQLVNKKIQSFIKKSIRDVTHVYSQLL